MKTNLPKLTGQICLFLAFVCLSVFSSLSQASAEQNRYGIIVWAKEYRSTAHVEFADRDADLIKVLFNRAFKIPENNIRVEKNPTKTDLDRLFGTDGKPGTLVNGVLHKDAEVFVYFAGHGSKEPDPVYRDTMNAYLMGIDSQPNDLENTGYLLTDVVDGLNAMRKQRFPNGRVHVILESCFSGSYSNGEFLQGVSAPSHSGQPAPLSLAKGVEGITLLTAAGSGQVAYWDPRRRWSVFTASLAEAISGEADGVYPAEKADGRVTYGELRRYLQNRVQQRVSQLNSDAEQTPEVKFADDDAVFLDFGESGPPVISALFREKNKQKRINATILQQDPSKLKLPELRKRRGLVETLESQCVTDCTPLAGYKQKIDRRLDICQSELGVYRQFVSQDALSLVAASLETCECCEHKSAINACIASGVSSSSQCACLLNDDCLSKTSPVCAPAFAEAKSHAEELRKTAPIDAFLKKHQTCPQIAEMRQFKVTFCDAEARRLEGSSDRTALSAFVDNMKSCPQVSKFVALRDRQQDCEAAWSTVRRRRLSDAVLADFLKEYEICPQFPEAQEMLQTRMGDARDAAGKASRQEELDLSREILEEFRDQFRDVMTPRQLATIRDELDNLGSLEKNKLCQKNFERAEAINSEKAYKEFIDRHSHCPQVPEARKRIDRLIANKSCGSAWSAVRYSNVARQLLDFMRDHPLCDNELREADTLLQQQVDVCIGQAESYARINRESGIGQIGTCIGQFNFGTKYYDQLARKRSELEKIVVGPIVEKPNPGDEARKTVLAYYSDLHNRRHNSAAGRWSRPTRKLRSLIRNTTSARVERASVGSTDGQNWATVNVDAWVSSYKSGNPLYYEVEVHLQRSGEKWYIVKIRSRS